jgi:formyl-CoA transferase/CoA:oxalate CoA-transferase
VVQALSGVMSVTGEPDGGPVLVGVPMADFTGAMSTAQAILLGLLARERTGRGQLIEAPMLAGMLFSLTTRLGTYWAAGVDSKRYGSAHSVVAPYQAFGTADGTIVTGAWTGDSWPRFCDAIERPDLVALPQFATNQDRVANRDQLNGILEPIFRSRTTADWEERFRSASALFAEVCDISRALDHPQAQSMHMVQSVEHTTLGEIPQMRAPIFMTETPGSIRRPPPVLGEHSEEILEQFGYSAEQITQLREAGIIRIHSGAPAVASAAASSASF